jgi:hypothetical protein
VVWADLKRVFEFIKAFLEALNLILGSHKLTKHTRKPVDLGAKMQDSGSNVLLDKRSDIDSNKPTPISQLQ